MQAEDLFVADAVAPASMNSLTRDEEWTADTKPHFGCRLCLAVAVAVAKAERGYKASRFLVVSLSLSH